MLGLLYRDYVNLKQSLKTTIISTGLIVIVFVLIDYGMAVTMLLPMMLAFISIGSLQWDAALKWRKVSVILPVKQHALVLSKYIVFLVLLLIGLLAGVIFGLLYMKATDFGLSNQHFTIGKAIALGITLPCAFGALFFPCAFYFKGEKLDMAMISCVTIMFVIIGAGALLIKYTTVDFRYEDLTTFIYASALLSALMLFLSYYISVEIFKRKEIC